MIPGTLLYTVKKLKANVKYYMSTGDRHVCKSIYNSLQINKEKYANNRSFVISHISEAERDILEKIDRMKGQCTDTNKLDDYLNAFVETEKKPLHVDISGDCKEIKNSVKNKPFSNSSLYIWDRSKNTFVETAKYIEGKISKTKLEQLAKRCIKAGVEIS